jgi:hypothetical protein
MGAAAVRVDNLDGDARMQETTSAHPDGKHAFPLVKILFQGHPLGLYGVREATPRRLLLRHGPISLPIGTRVDIHDMTGGVPFARGTAVSATVVGNSAGGLTLAL